MYEQNERNKKSAPLDSTGNMKKIYIEINKWGNILNAGHGAL